MFPTLNARFDSTRVPEFVRDPLYILHSFAFVIVLASFPWRKFIYDDPHPFHGHAYPSKVTLVGIAMFRESPVFTILSISFSSSVFAFFMI